MASSKESTLKKRKSSPRCKNESNTLVYVRESDSETWSEAIDLAAISRFGAGFSLSRECNIGQLILLSIPPSVEFPTGERFDGPRSIVGLVQQCGEVKIGGRLAFHTGVVFVGKQLPASYDANPKQCYRVCGSDVDGFFNIKETGAQFKPRRCPRFHMKLELSLTLIRKIEKTIVRAKGMTKDIGASGASVICSLNAMVGDKIKFGCREIDFYTIATVRNRRTLFGFEVLLHLEFTEDRLPIERVLFGRPRPSITF